MKEALDDLKEGICVGVELIQSVRYADDQAMTAYTEKGLHKILDETNRVLKNYGVEINIKRQKSWRLEETQYYKDNCGRRNTATGGRI